MYCNHTCIDKYKEKNAYVTDKGKQEKKKSFLRNKDFSLMISDMQNMYWE